MTSKAGTLAATGLPTSVSGNTFNADNGMTGFGGATLSYDANGNLTSDGTNTYTWDARNHLEGIGGGATASFVYDGFGRRAQKTVNGPATQILYDGLDTVQEQNSSNGTANFLTGLNIDEYFTRADSGNNVSTLLRDTLGSTIGLVGSGQSIATTYTYQPFGGTSIAGATNGNSYQFTGRENDGTGLYADRARYYSPVYQRFISQDPAGFRGGDANLYVYVFNNPVVDVDPLGLGTFQVGLGGSVTGGDGMAGAGASFSVGLVIDGNGNVGIYMSVGGSLGTAEGLSGSGGIDQQVSNANCIKDLRGPFLETVGTVGPVSGDIFTGVGQQGQLVVGGGGVVGVGAGISGQGAVTGTIVHPLGNIWNFL